MTLPAHAVRCAILVALVALGVRILVAWQGYASLQADVDDYARLAVVWSSSGTFGFDSHVATAFRPPLYPWVLSFLVQGSQVSRVAVAILHVVLGIATAIATYALGTLLIRGRYSILGSSLAALAVIVDPILMRQQQLIMTESAATAITVALAVLWITMIDRLENRWSTTSSSGMNRTEGSILRPTMVGLTLGASVLLRPTFLPLCFLLIGSVIWMRSSWMVRVRTILVIAGGLVVVLVPWGLRNQTRVGKFTTTTTHGGYTLLLANNPSIFQHFKDRGFSRDWDASDFHRRWALRNEYSPLESSFWERKLTDPITPPDARELEDDRLAYAVAWQTIREQPALFLKGTLVRLSWLWALAPDGLSGADGSSPTEPARGIGIRTAIGAWYTVWYCLAIAGCLRLLAWDRFRSWYFPIAVVISLSAVHAVYWSNMRMRAPAMPMVYLLASWFVVEMLVRRHRPAQETSLTTSN